MPTPDFILELRKQVGHAPLFLTGVNAVVLREHEGRTQALMVKRADNGAWTTVAGIVEPGQEVHEVAIREVAEETTVAAVPVRLLWIRTHEPQTYPNGDVVSYVNLTFLMRWVSGEPAVGDDESTEARWWWVDELPPLDAAISERIGVAVADEPGVLFGPLPGMRL